MMDRVSAVLFDMGGTLRTRIEDPAMRREALEELKRLLDYRGDPEELSDHLSKGAAAYKRWAEETLHEAPEEEIWARWMTPEIPAERVQELSVQLEHLWRATQGRRVVRPDAKRVVSELEARGYELGVISNTTSREAVPRGLREYGLAEHFPVVVLSSTSGYRKPGTRIFALATDALGVDPGACAYVGDRPSRDVVGARAAGFAMTVLIHGDAMQFKEDVNGCPPADHTIETLSELLDIFE